MEISQLYDLIKNSGGNIHIDTLYKAKKAGYMSRSLSIICEKATGIPRWRWTYPDRFGDPWVARIRKAT